MITAVSWFLEFHLFICLFVTCLFGSLEHAVKYLSVLPPNLWPNWLPMQRWNSSSSTFRALTVVVLRVLISKLSRVRRLNCQRTWETDQAEKRQKAEWSPPHAWGVERSLNVYSTYITTGMVQQLWMSCDRDKLNLLLVQRVFLTSQKL